MVTLSPAYSITIKVGEMLFAGHVDNSLSIVPNYEPILRKTLGGRFDLDFVGVDLDMQVSGLTYERTTAEAATHYDFAALRAACNSSASVTFVYGDITPGKVVLTGNAKLTGYQETAGSGKVSANWSCRLRSVRGSVQEEVVPPAVQDVKYGLLYNWYAATDARNIAAAGWHVPLISDWFILCLYLDPDADYGEYGEASYYIDSYLAGGKLKELGEVYWNNPNVGATNEVGFNGKGSGWRGYDYGFFYDLKVKNVLWAGDSTLGSALVYFINDDTYFSATNYNSANYETTKRDGHSIRLVKDTTTLTHGQTGTYIGNDGKVYRTICIGTQEWLADNLCETLYRNGDPIPEVTGDAAWAALTTGAMCAYNNDWTNV